MARRRPRLFGSIVAAAALLVVALVFIPASRNKIASLGIRSALALRGYHLDSGQFDVGPAHAHITGLRISDADGLLFAAASIDADYDLSWGLGPGARRYGLSRVQLEQPVLRLVRHADGDYNVTPLFGNGPSNVKQTAPAAPGTYAAPLRLTLRVLDGTVIVDDAFAAVKIGRHVIANRIAALATLDQGARSVGVMTAMVRSLEGATPVRGTLLEDDAARFARADLSAHAIAIGPLYDCLVPTPAFVIERGLADVRLTAYSLAYDPLDGPAWQLSGLATVRDGRAHAYPLRVPVRDIAGHVRLAGGSMTTDDLEGTASGVPVTIRGGMHLVGGVRFELGIQTQGELPRVRTLFAFSDQYPVEGPVTATLRLTGPPDNIHVLGQFEGPSVARYAGFPVSGLHGTFFYSDQHFTLPHIAGEYAGASVRGDGDIDLSGDTARGKFIAVSAVPASQLPIANSVNPGGEAQALVTLTGPLSTMTGLGYAQIVGGNSTLVRTAFAAGPDGQIVGPMLVQRDGGELLLRAAVDRRVKPRRVEAAIIARDVPIDVVERSTTLPGVSQPIYVPSVSGRFDGVAYADGPLAAPNISIAMTAGGLTIAGARFGDTRVVARGNDGLLDIASIDAAGADARLHAGGVARVAPATGRYSFALRGDGQADLTRLGTIAPGFHLRGTAAGTFVAIGGEGRWLATARGNGDGSVLGVPVTSGDATVGGGKGGFDVFAGTFAVAGGDVAAIGHAPAPSGGDGNLTFIASHLDIDRLHSLGVPLTGGTALAVGAVHGDLAHPAVVGSALVDGSHMRGVSVGGDVDFDYAGNRLSTSAGNISIAGNRASVAGTIDGLGANAPVNDARLALDVQLMSANVASLVDPYLPQGTHMQGGADAGLHVGGTIASPTLDGAIAASTGTLQGVIFDGLSGTVHARNGSLDVRSGAVRIGSSALAFSGTFSRPAYRIATSSSHVDLSDFNDFFNGWDVLDGRGSGALDISSSPRGFAGGGQVHVSDAVLSGMPLGQLDARFFGGGNTLRADVHQQGAIGTSDFVARAIFRSNSGLPDVRTAYFDVTGRTTDLDLSIVAPHVGAEDFGIVGKLAASGELHGRLERPIAHAVFALHDGHFRKLAIDEFSGTVDTDGKRTDLRHAVLRLPFAAASGDAHLGPGDHVSGLVDANAADLSKLMAAVGLPGAAAGSAGLRLAVSGTRSAPHVIADLQSRNSNAYGVAFDSLVAHVRYAPGEVEIGNTSLDLGPRRGHATLAGTLPLRLAPFGLGPKNRPVDLRFAASALDLTAFNGLIAPFGTLGGSLNASLSARGSAGNPDLAGSAQLRDGKFKPSFERTPLDNVVADLTLAHDTVTLTHFHGALGRGTLDAGGAAHVVPAAGLLSEAGLQYSAHLRTSGAQVDVPNWLSGAFDSDLSIVKSGTTPYLSGTVTMNDGTIPFSAIYALAQGFSGGQSPPAVGGIPGVPPLRPGHTIAYGGAIYGPTIHILKYSDVVAPPPLAGVAQAPNVDVDVTASAGRNVHVKGGAIDLSANGKVRIAKNLRSPTLEGSFHSTRGQVTYFDTVFRLREGTVTFDPAEGLLPTLDVVADTNAGDVQITVAIRGRVDNLNTDFTSSPPLTRDQIVATLLHAPQVASVFTATPDQAQSLLTTEAQNYFNAQLTRSLLFPIESALADTLNIQQISFLFDKRGNVNIEVRTKVTSTVYALYRSSLTVPVSQTFGVAYALRDYTSLNFIQTTDPTGQQSTTAELRFTFK